MTAGIVSAKGRDTGDYLPFIQTDVAINPGNSGGPLFNMAGEVIGINSQIYSRTGGFMGISFAIPIDDAMRVADQLKTVGKVMRGRIGVAIGEVTKDVADSLGLPKAQGALVSSVEAGGPADKAGIEPGDIILKYDGHDVETATDLPRIVGDTKPGTKVTLTVWRKGQTRDLPITVAEMQPDKVAKAEQKKTPVPKERASNSLGLAVSDLTADQKKELQADERRAGRRGGRPGGARGLPEGRRHPAHRRHGHHEREAVRSRRAECRSEQDGRRARAARRQHAVRAVAPARAGAEVSGGDGIVHALRARVLPPVRRHARRARADRGASSAWHRVDRHRHAIRRSRRATTSACRCWSLRRRRAVPLPSRRPRVRAALEARAASSLKALVRDELHAAKSAVAERRFG